MENELKFESALEELEKIINELESGNTPLDDAINKYNKAMQLVKFCSDKLSNATEVVNKIMSEAGSLEDFKIDDE